MKVNLKEPRYILPLIALPFLFIFFYLYKASFGKEETGNPPSNRLQEDIAEVSDQVKNAEISDKLDAYRDRYKDGNGYTAIGEITGETPTIQAVPEIYNQKEKNMLDSIEQSMKQKYGAVVSSLPDRSSHFPDVTRNIPRRVVDNDDKALAEALSKLKETSRVESYAEEESISESDPLTLFRQQMALIDSMGKANDPEFKAEVARQRQVELAENMLKNRKRLPVSRSTNQESTFNTVLANRNESFIRAIVDQNVTAYSGSRLRIRLLDNLFAGKFLIRKGTYLYAQVSGFTGQRINLSITSILQGDQILPVRLDVYDNDGLPGLYVPASAFREFSKGLGITTSQGMNFQQAETNSQLVMSLLQKMFQSTSTAVTKLIRQNKAKLKYNTRVYLIDPEELKNNQNNY